MATEILAVPEEHLADVIHIIRSGIRASKSAVQKGVLRNLRRWCDEESEYLKRIQEES